MTANSWAMNQTTPPAAAAEDVPPSLYGRRAGRGLRPWLLVPKVLSVGLFLGGSVAVLSLVGMSRPQSADQCGQLTRHLSLVFRAAVIPGAIAAVVFGVLLLLQCPRVLFAQRWMKVKLLVLAMGIPTLHVVARAGLDDMRQDGWRTDSMVGAASGPSMMLAAMAVCVVMIVIVVILGRHKPRLGQDWAKTYARITAKKRP